MKSSSPFCSTEKFVKKDFTETEFVHFMEVEEVSSDYDPKKPSEFLIEKHVEEYERIPIDEYINSFSSKVGLKNELRGVVSKQQMDDFITEHKAQPGFVDLTKLPDTELGMKNAALSADKIWDELPTELKGKMTKEEFIKTISFDKLRQFIFDDFNKKNAIKNENKEEK